MKKKETFMSQVFYGFGWILLGLFLAINFFLRNKGDSLKDVIVNSNTIQNYESLFKGSLSCALSDQELLDRKQFLKQNIFPAVKEKEKTEYGLLYYFEDDDDLLKDLMEFVKLEKACCPFFRFDLTILPFEQGIGLQISGSKAAVKFLEDFERNEF